MKLRKTLAAVVAAAMAVTMVAIPASAEEKVLFTVSGSNTILDVTNILPEGRVVDDVYGATVTFAESAKETLAAGAGGGFIFSCGDKNWSQLQWCTGCEEETHDIQYDAETNSVTRLDAEPVLITDTDGVDPYYQFAICTWWPEEASLDVVGFTLLDKDGNALTAATTPDDDTTNDDNADDDSTVGDSEEVPGDSEEVPEKEPAAPAKVEIANGGKTVLDKGLVRTNIINAWAGDDACVIAEKEAFAGANLVSVKFTVTGVKEAFDAWISLADSSWAVQYWGADNDGNLLVTQTPITIEKDGTYVVTAELGQVIDAMEFIAICTNLEAAEGDEIPTIAIDEIMINEEIEAPAADDEVPGESSGEPTNPGTGVTLVVVPAALAAAALATSGIVLKKRSK